ncbi:zinc finger protein [Rhizophagus irregularis DAOM 181602=DAOM 197198]|nr:zinc finger protein [Rhizophagus irregularis DAOM 181602=DAOM 197198]
MIHKFFRDVCNFDLPNFDLYNFSTEHHRVIHDACNLPNFIHYNFSGTPVHISDNNYFGTENYYTEQISNQNTPPKQYVSLREIENNMVSPMNKDRFSLHPETIFKVRVDHINQVTIRYDDPMTSSRMDGTMNYFLSDQIQSQVYVNGIKFLKSNKKNYQIVNEPMNPDKIKFLCNYPGCTKHFKDNHHLKVHQRKHTGEKPFTCDYQGCKRRFSQKNNLKTHQRIHKGERPYECEVCHKTFRQPTNLNAHRKRIHEPFLLW